MYKSFIEQCALMPKRQFKLRYRLNAECNWQSCLVDGSDIDQAKAGLLNAVTTIYQIRSNGVEIEENSGVQGDF